MKIHITLLSYALTLCSPNSPLTFQIFCRLFQVHDNFFSVLFFFFCLLFVMGCPESKVTLCFQCIQWHFDILNVFLFFFFNTVK